MLEKCDNSLTDLFCYTAVLGFVVMVVFDSQQVSIRKHQAHVHIVGVALVTVGDAMLHAFVAFTILSSTLNVNETGPRPGLGNLQVLLATLVLKTLVGNNYLRPPASCNRGTAVKVKAPLEEGCCGWVGPTTESPG